MISAKNRENKTILNTHIVYNCKKVAVIALLILFPYIQSIDAKDSDISWNEAEKEVDSLVFTKHFVDSVKEALHFSPDNKSLRQIKAIPVIHEKLVYEIAWGPFKAGYVILLMDHNKSDNTIRLGGKGLSNNFVSAFYKMRDYNLSTIDADGLYPIFFEEHLREGKKYKADRWMLFDNKLEKLHKKGKKFETIDAPLFSHDYLSILFYVRSMTTAPGDTFTLNMYNDSKIRPMKFTCYDFEDIEVPSGTFRCIKIVPKLVGNAKTFNQKDKLEVFLSDDTTRMPIMIKSKIKFGSITAKLIWYSKND